MSESDHLVDESDTGADLIGKTHVFEDGIMIRVLQSKRRNVGWWITFEIVHPGSFPRKLVESVGEFRNKFDHIFKGTK
jgi:hypothetical protein